MAMIGCDCMLTDAANEGGKGRVHYIRKTYSFSSNKKHPLILIYDIKIEFKASQTFVREATIPLVNYFQKMDC
jgi:hypothetical protein